jgi:hypothetical protein
MIEITPKTIDTIIPQFEFIDKNYVFDYGLSKLSSIENELSPPVVPILWNSFFAGKILSDIELCNIISNSPDFSLGEIEGVSASVNLFARCRQFWTGFLREVDFIIKLNKYDPDGKIYKNIEADIGYGAIDIVYISSSGKEFCFALKMRGGSSNFSRDKRKIAKTDKNVVPVFVSVDEDHKYALAKVEDDVVEGIVEYGKRN